MTDPTGDRLPTGGKRKRGPEAAGTWFMKYICGAAWGRRHLGGLWGRARGRFCGGSMWRKPRNGGF